MPKMMSRMIPQKIFPQVKVED